MQIWEYNGIDAVYRYIFFFFFNPVTGFDSRPTNRWTKPRRDESTESQLPMLSIIATVRYNASTPGQLGQRERERIHYRRCDNVC